MRIGVILLAAGEGRRFGSDKRRARLASGAELLHATLRRYAEVFTELRVAIRPNDDALAQSLAPLLRSPAQQIVRAPHAAAGMGATLADAIASARAWDLAFVALGDMPFVTFSTLRLLHDCAAGLPPNCSILQPRCGDVPGHPVAFRRSLFDALAALQGDAGARSIVRAQHAHCRSIEVLDAGVLQDVDSPASLAGARAARTTPIPP